MYALRYAGVIRLLVLLFGLSAAAKAFAQATEDFDANTITLGVCHIPSTGNH